MDNDEIREHITSINSEMDKLYTRVDGLELSIRDIVNDEISSQFDSISKELRDIHDIHELKEWMRIKTKSVVALDEEIAAEIKKVKETIISLAEYIDIRKKINLRKEEPEKPKIISDTLREIVEELEN